MCGRCGVFLACPGWRECNFTRALGVEMPGKCPLCGGRLVKRTGTSKKTHKQYTYYCCEHLNSKDESRRCEFRTWDVPVKDYCPECGHTMFKKAGRGYKRPFCINEKCPNFLPEEKRGGFRKKTEEGEGTATAESQAEQETPKKKTAAKKTTAKKSTTKKTTAKSTTAKKATTKKTSTKAAKQAEEA